MKKLVCIALIFSLCRDIAFTQNIDHLNGSFFTKTVEYNILSQYQEDISYNVSSKSTLERVLFGNTNSEFEFVSTLRKNGVISGFRFRQTTDSCYILEVFSTTGEGLRLLDINTTEIVLPAKFKNMKFLSVQGEEWVKNYNKEVIMAKSSGEAYKPYHREPKSFYISNEFAKQLHTKTSSLISNFKAEGIPRTIVGGHSVTFRCVVGSELWTLKIHIPQNKAEELADVFQLIMTDSFDTDELDEIKYLDLLNNIDL